MKLEASKSVWLSDIKLLALAIELGTEASPSRISSFRQLTPLRMPRFLTAELTCPKFNS